CESRDPPTPWTPKRRALHLHGAPTPRPGTSPHCVPLIGRRLSALEPKRERRRAGTRSELRRRRRLCEHLADAQERGRRGAQRELVALEPQEVAMDREVHVDADAAMDVER